MNEGSIDLSMLDIFRTEAESQTQALISGLLALERDPRAADSLEACMRAAHSLKGASRIVGLSAGVEVAHAMEDCFVAAQQGRPAMDSTRIDLMLQGVDLLARMARTPEETIARWVGKTEEVDAFILAVSHLPQESGGGEAAAPDSPETGKEEPAKAVPAPVPVPAKAAPEPSNRVLRVTAENLNRLLSLTGEAVVESRWLKPFVTSLFRLKRLHRDITVALEDMTDASVRVEDEATAAAAASTAKQRVHECQQFLTQRLAELEAFDLRAANLAQSLYDEALAIRMRPFADGIGGFPRLVRDLGHTLGKRVRLEISGERAQVDRDVLEKLKEPLDHLLRNAVDHGVESPEERRAAGKPEEAVVRLEARHSAGTLQIAVFDEGRGVDLARLRSFLVERKLAAAETVGALSEPELLEFLFLPGFTMKGELTKISGRGVGLDVVRNMVREVRGTIHVSTRQGEGTRFQLQLPLTLSVIRSLLVEIGGEPYAFPLVHVVRTLKIPKDQVESLEGRPHIALEGRRIGLVAARRVLGSSGLEPEGGEFSVVVVGKPGNDYGLVVDRFLGERELVVQPLDPRLGKIKDINASALMEDGTPVLIVDAEDMLRSVEKLVSSARPELLRHDAATVSEEKRLTRILVVDDSLTVRELERKLLGNRGYEVEVAIDGMDGLNAVRGSRFDLVISDIDMPRLDGIELVRLIKRDAKLKSLPVMIVSYKDREEDRQRGLDAGADYYLAKGNFDNETLLQAVVDLIGEVEG